MTKRTATTVALVGCIAAGTAASVALTASPAPSEPAVAAQAEAVQLLGNSTEIDRELPRTLGAVRREAPPVAPARPAAQVRAAVGPQAKPASPKLVAAPPKPATLAVPAPKRKTLAVAAPKPKPLAAPAPAPKPRALALAPPKRASRAATRLPVDPRAIAKVMLAQRGWSGQYSCLDSLWTRESGWRVNADNPTSDAYGIPQSLPGSKMASAGADWRTNPATQIRWGLSYIASAYGSPCAAWRHSQAYNYY